MSSSTNAFLIKHVPMLMRNADFNSIGKILNTVGAKYEEGSDVYNQFLDECRQCNDDAYPSYLN